MKAPEVGDVAPDLTLPDHTGKPLRLRDLRGRVVVVTFYAEDFTPACTEQVRGFCELETELARAGAVVLGVSPDDVATHAKFARELGRGVRLLSDPEKSVMRRWGAFGEKTLYGRKVQGAIRSTFVVGKDGRVLVAQRGIRAKGHARRVLAALEATDASKGPAQKQG